MINRTKKIDLEVYAVLEAVTIIIDVGGQRLAKFAWSDRVKPFIDADTLHRIENPIKFIINNMFVLLLRFLFLVFR